MLRLLAGTLPAAFVVAARAIGRVTAGAAANARGHHSDRGPVVGPLDRPSVIAPHPLHRPRPPTSRGRRAPGPRVAVVLRRRYADHHRRPGTGMSPCHLRHPHPCHWDTPPAGRQGKSASSQGRTTSTPGRLTSTPTPWSPWSGAIVQLSPPFRWGDSLRNSATFCRRSIWCTAPPWTISWSSPDPPVQPNVSSKLTSLRRLLFT